MLLFLIAVGPKGIWSHISEDLEIPPHGVFFFSFLNSLCQSLKNRLKDDADRNQFLQADSSWFILLSASEEQSWFKVTLRVGGH